MITWKDVFRRNGWVALAGFGAHGHDMADSVGWRDGRQVWPYDDNPDASTDLHGSIDDLIFYTNDDLIFYTNIRYAVGVNNGRMRQQIVGRLERGGVVNDCDGVWVHPAATVDEHSTELGRHTHINGGAFITRASLGEFCTVGPNATICGDVTIGNLVSVGAGAVVCEFSTIGDGATIGAGCVLPPHTIVGAGQTWVGVPGKPIR